MRIKWFRVPSTILHSLPPLSTLSTRHQHQFTEEGQYPDHISTIVVLITLLAAVFIYHIVNTNIDFYCRHRTLILFAFRIHRVIALMHLIPPGGPLPKTSLWFPSSRAAAVVAPLLTESAFVFLPGIGYQLVSCLQVWMNIITLALPCKEATRVCFNSKNILSSFPIGDDSTAAAAITEHSTLMSTHSTIASVLDSISQTLIPSVSLVDDGGPFACLRVRYWIVVLFGFVLPLFLTAQLEERHRHQFLIDKGYLYSYVFPSPMHPWSLLHGGTWVVCQAYILWIGMGAVAVIAHTLPTLLRN